jgi:Domain of unknown function (DUF1330)
MKSKYTLGLALVTGVAIGAVAVEVLHAQGKPPVHTIAEIQIKKGDRDAYMKEFAPNAQAALKNIAGSQFVAAGTATKIEGEPPPPSTRVTIRRYNSMEDAKASLAGVQGSTENR